MGTEDGSHIHLRGKIVAGPTSMLVDGVAALCEEMANGVDVK